MSFVSLAFFIFFPLVLLSQLVIPGTRGRHVALLVASYVFSGWWDWRFCGLMLLLTAVAYLAGLGLERRPRSRGILAAGVAVPLAVLFAFKYLNFFLASFRAAFGLAQAGALNIILPVGISFYTFQSLSYTIDVYRGKLPASHDPVKFALYISFFPQLVAGPIVKASEFLPQLDEARRPTADRVFRGLTEFFFGLFKKAVLADNIAVFADAVFGAVGAYSSGAVALAVLGYAMQIYFDFSGYSDMAMGAARCLGYDLPVNFNLPYLSRNASEFWKRWHISLSSWLQQYLYIPLGGNRKGRARTYVNLMLTMALGGLWHGADWSFVLWGVGHGLALCAHKAWSTRFPARRGRAADGAVRRIDVGALPGGEPRPRAGDLPQAVRLGRGGLGAARLDAGGAGLHAAVHRLEGAAARPDRGGAGRLGPRAVPGQLPGHAGADAAGGLCAGADVHGGEPLHLLPVLTERRFLSCNAQKK